MSEEKKSGKIESGLTKIPLLKKFKNIKHIEIIICIIFIGLLLLIYFCGFNFKTSSSGNITSQDNNTSIVSSQNYAKYIEDKICSLLSNLKGVNNVSVLVRVSENLELNVATTIEEKTNTDKTVTKTITPIIVTENGESRPIVLNENLPKILGVVVVATGAEDVNVKLNIYKAIQTITEVSGENIQVFAGK